MYVDVQSDEICVVFLASYCCWKYYICGHEDNWKMAVHGQLSIYTERLQFLDYFTANDIVTKEKRRAILLSVRMWCSHLQKDQEPCSTVEADREELRSDHYNPAQNLLLLSSNVFSMSNPRSLKNQLQSSWQSSKDLRSPRCQTRRNDAGSPHQ